MSQRDAHESYAVAAGQLHWIALVLAVSLTAVVAAMYLLFRLWVANRPGVDVGPPPPEPRLQVHPQHDLAVERTRENGRLKEYAWNDPSHASARIPIDRAMQLLVQQRSHADAPGGTP